MRRVRAVALGSGIAAAASLVIVAGALGAPRSLHPARAKFAQFGTQTRRALTSIVVSGMGAGAMPGMVLGVWVPGNGSFVRAFGTSDLASHAPMRSSDHFRIASITKSFTAVAILRLVDQGKLSLTAPIRVPGAVPPRTVV